MSAITVGLLVAILLAPAAQAESRGRFAVFVRDSMDHRPVRSARVRLVEGEAKEGARVWSAWARRVSVRAFTITDEMGRGVINEVPLGPAVLQAFADNYEFHVGPFVTVSDRLDTVRIDLARRPGFDPDSLPSAWWKPNPDTPRITPISEFWSLDSTELSTVQMKFTWGGSSMYSRPSGLLRGDRAGIDVAAFEPFHRCEPWFYRQDGGSPSTAVLGARRMKDLLDRLAEIPGLQHAEMEPYYALSFSVLALRKGKPIVFECILADTTRRDLFRALFAATRGDSEASGWARDLGCRYFNPLPDDLPEEVTDLVKMEATGFRREAARDTYFVRGQPHAASVLVTHVRISNRSNRLLPAPLTLGLDGYMGDVFLLDSGNSPCHLQDRFALDLPVGAGLRPGESVVTTVRLDAGDEKMLLTGHVYAGPGVR